MLDETIGRYKITGELGKGAMGVVYRAVDPTIGRTVALKSMRFDVHGIDAEEMAERFRNEARAAGVLNHPNLITIFDAGEHDGAFYIAMECLEGDSLHSVLREQRMLPVERVVEIGTQICAGLAHAHEHGIVHRDIKPANIMITRNGTVKIMDFGIAKAVGTGLTSSGQVLGTPNYMSPEQVKGKRLDGRTDIFSLGVMLYEMVTGERPFGGQNVTTILYKIVHEKAIPPRELDVTVHPGLSAVIQRALAKNPEARYESAAQLAADLKNYKSLRAEPAAGASEEAQPAAAPATAEPPQPAPPKTPAGAGATTLARMKLEVAPREPRRFWMLSVGLLVVLAVAIALVGAGLQRRRGSASAPVEEAAAAAATAPAGTTTAPPASPSVAAGTLNVTSSPPGAQVRVDGTANAAWNTPFVASDLAPGTHKLSFSKNGYVPAAQTVEVRAGEAASVHVQLRPSSQGVLALTSTPPDAAILVDDADTKQRTPARVRLEQGEHRFVLRKEGYKDFAANITVTAGGTHNFAPRLEPEAGGGGIGGGLRRLFGAGIPKGKGVLNVRTEPAGAKVTINGQAAKDSPLRIPVEPGTYDVALQMQGYQPVQRKLEVREGKVAELKVTLQKR